MRILLALLAMAGPAFAADPIEGTWRTTPNGKGGVGLVQVAPCGPAFCGTVAGDLDAQGRVVPSDIQGRTVFRDVTGANGTYSGGRVINPANGKSYAARLILKGDTLDVGGCLLGICRSGGVWQRLD
ncbi:DUF2147 domain-containing protein [Falsirhodobacter sp. 20TX0035]|uniref:DUF2147 domain-containing protein n=1 Tax=Falsirhodobacter sp. 20TX0035 TaxID=3022019 RepID=UPI00232C5E99|nr:DUF2147 domain-containing protein [Falsirhodobacter sp. 20TX0035]MDB6452090.1 DUF2147 domain-containing protein [Falsirhodobacter sp. 20TX0035]